MHEIFVKPIVSVQRSLSHLFQGPLSLLPSFLRVFQAPDHNQQNRKHSVNNHAYPSEIVSRIHPFIFL